jgi:hypothetical protein
MRSRASEIGGEIDVNIATCGINDWHLFVYSASKDVLLNLEHLKELTL